MTTKQPTKLPASLLSALVSQIAEVVRQARGHVRLNVNQAMVASYWEIGRLIVEHEQQGQARAAYGQRQLAELSARLTELFGRGFDASNLRNMRRFYLAFPIRETLPLELSWSHYILLEDSQKSYHARYRVSERDIFDNRLIFRGNLLALKALEAAFSGRVKCGNGEFVWRRRGEE
ncbi:hypothetical protein FACS1894154_11180 [Betaproteobacteria bacterium]|nr:hypothetical protein FACS1894154_11180 [Betaproteobacteria bacterium]GHU24827.1 hypothetical protein FACS189488_10330 [Betaproteobacteria bacterium]GHU29966.1 hypothetical protein FACS189497_08920 [Betaproteobacteria bacterium]